LVGQKPKYKEQFMDVIELLMTAALFAAALVLYTLE
jgi:hypothetical protein